jgi:hypothetical protein
VRKEDVFISSVEVAKKLVIWEWRNVVWSKGVKELSDTHNLLGWQVFLRLKYLSQRFGMGLIR